MYICTFKSGLGKYMQGKCECRINEICTHIHVTICTYVISTAGNFTRYANRSTLVIEGIAG